MGLISMEKALRSTVETLERTLVLRVLQQAVKVSFWTCQCRVCQGACRVATGAYGTWRVYTHLVPLVINLLLGVNVAAKEILVGPEKSNGGVGLVDKEVGEIPSLEDAVLVNVGLLVLGVLLAPTNAIRAGLVCLVHLHGDHVRALGEDSKTVLLTESSDFLGLDALDGDANFHGAIPSLLESCDALDVRILKKATSRSSRVSSK